jgi:hypothetical protein
MVSTFSVIYQHARLLLLVRIKGGSGVFGNNPFLQDDLDADLPFGIYPRRLQRIGRFFR